MKRLWFLLLGVMVVAGVITATLLLWPKPFIPGKIRDEVISTIFIPNGKRVDNKRGTVKYDNSLKLLSYQSTIFGANTIISEQPTPVSFTDIPEVYQRVLDSWKQYGQFDTATGTVYLTRPGNQNDKEVGVMNSKGTLMFVKSDKDLSDDQWRQIFNNLQIVPLK